MYIILSTCYILSFNLKMAIEWLKCRFFFEINIFDEKNLVWVHFKDQLEGKNVLLWLLTSPLAGAVAKTLPFGLDSRTQHYVRPSLSLSACELFF